MYVIHFVRSFIYIILPQYVYNVTLIKKSFSNRKPFVDIHSMKIINVQYVSMHDHV